MKRGLKLSFSQKVDHIDHWGKGQVWRDLMKVARHVISLMERVSKSSMRLLQKVFQLMRVSI